MADSEMTDAKIRSEASVVHHENTAGRLAQRGENLPTGRLGYAFYAPDPKNTIRVNSV